MFFYSADFRTAVVISMEGLRGKNRIESFTRVADEIVKSISHFSSVEGILYLGGLTRGFVDKYSDLDMMVLFNNDDPFAKGFLESLSAQHEDRSGLAIDIETYFLDEYLDREWPEYLRWDLSNAVYAFDRQGEVQHRVQRKLHLDDEAWKRKLAHPLVYLSWYCCPTAEYIPSMVDLWQDRGHHLSVQYSVSYCVELLIQAIYWLNRSYLPAPKWRLFYIRNLRWKPDDIESLLEEALLVKEISDTDARRRIDVVSKINDEICHHADEVFGLDRDTIRKLYIEEVYGRTG